MAVNKLSKLRLSTGSSSKTDTLLNKEHPEPAAASTCADIEWQWTSPVGTVSNVKIRAGKTPLQSMKTPCESISPISNNFPRKRKLMKDEEIEIETEFRSSLYPDALHYIPECDPTINTELAEKNARKGGPQCSNEDYCALFDDGEDAMDECLIQLSQTVEKDLTENPKGNVHLVTTTPRSTRVHSALTKTGVLSVNRSSAATKQCTIENNIPHVETREGPSNGCSSLPSSPSRRGTNPSGYTEGQPHSQTVHTHIALHKTILDAPSATCENATKYDIDDSYDDILVTFCEENVELLSQPVNEHILKKNNNPLNVVPKLQTSSRAAVTKVSDSRRPVVSTRQVPQQAATKSSNNISLTPVLKYEQLNCDKTLDDDFLQPDLLKLLESVEANSQPQPASQILRCTPEEIEHKRRQAKMKLERKKIALKSGLVRI